MLMRCWPSGRGMRAPLGPGPSPEQTLPGQPLMDEACPGHHGSDSSARSPTCFYGPGRRRFAPATCWAGPGAPGPADCMSAFSPPHTTWGGSGRARATGLPQHGEGLPLVQGGPGHPSPRTCYPPSNWKLVFCWIGPRRLFLYSLESFLEGWGRMGGAWLGIETPSCQGAWGMGAGSPRAFQGFFTVGTGGGTCWSLVT